MYQKGMEFEAEITARVHEQGRIPLLVSPQFLRARGCSQLDAVVISGDTIHIIEAKSSGWTGYKQRKRLANSANLLSNLLNYNCQLWLAKKLLPNGSRFLTLNL